jgi:hypothetical protein
LQLKRRHLCRVGKSLVAILLIGVVLFMAALASSEGLHKLFHHDANDARHECAVTLFAQGHIESAACDVPTTLPATLVAAVPCLDLVVFNSTIENLPPGRAPPAVASSQV